MLTSTNNTVMPSSRAREGRNRFTNKRHEIIKKKYQELRAFRFQGLKLDPDEIISRIAEEIGYSERTIKDILKRD